MRNSTRKETYLEKAVHYKRFDNCYKRYEYRRDRDYGSYRDRSRRDYSRRSGFRSYDRRDDKDGDKRYGSWSKDGGNKGNYGKEKFNKFKGRSKGRGKGTDKVSSTNKINQEDAEDPDNESGEEEEESDEDEQDEEAGANAVDEDEEYFGRQR